jgi:hypothetical protein
MITVAGIPLLLRQGRQPTSGGELSLLPFSEATPKLQFYSYNLNIANIILTLTDARVTNNLNVVNRIFFTLINDRNASPAPVLNYTDHQNNTE